MLQKFDYYFLTLGNDPEGGLKIRKYAIKELLLFFMTKASPIPRAKKQEISYENVNVGMTVSPGG